MNPQEVAKRLVEKFQAYGLELTVVGACACYSPAWPQTLEILTELLSPDGGIPQFVLDVQESEEEEDE